MRRVTHLIRAVGDALAAHTIIVHLLGRQVQITTIDDGWILVGYCSQKMSLGYVLHGGGKD